MRWAPAHKGLSGHTQQARPAALKRTSAPHSDRKSLVTSVRMRKEETRPGLSGPEAAGPLSTVNEGKRTFPPTQASSRSDPEGSLRSSWYLLGKEAVRAREARSTSAH